MIIVLGNDNWSGKNDSCPGKMTIGLVKMTNAETLTDAKEVKGSEKRKRLADLLKNQKKDLFFTRCAQIKKPEKSACKGHFPVVVSISLLKKSSTTTDDLTWIHSLSSLYELVMNRKKLKKVVDKHLYTEV